MLIRDVKFYIQPDGTRRRSVANGGMGTIEKVPPGLSGLFTHSGGFRDGSIRIDEALIDPGALCLQYTAAEESPHFKSTIRLVTDGDFDAYAGFGSGFHADDLEWAAKEFKVRLAPMLLGVDAFDREFIWQRLWYAQRFFYTGRGVVDMVDRMLWNLASRYACMPVYKLLGASRERIPAYRNIGGDTIDDLVASALKVREDGFVGCKDHSYRGVRGNTELGTELRRALGDDFILLHDPVESYTCMEAIQIGRQLEKLNYTWIEEPLQDYDIMGLKKLCDALDLPVLTLEWIGAIGGQPFNTAPYLALGAADIVRQRGVGITGSVKQAQLAESFGVRVHGGDPNTILANSNDPIFEAAGGGLAPRPPDDELDCLGTTVVEDGWMSIAWKPVRPPEPDWDEIERTSVAVV